MAPPDAELLFAERARAVSADFEPDEHVAAICAAVDGLPLAIELAAARVRSLSTRSILERLSQRLDLLTSKDRDVDQRQRTLEATISWSYDLLDPIEQRALRKLSVFAGGCTLEAAEHVAGADLELLESLLDKSLIRRRIDQAGHDRYWMLETIREYLASRLDAAGEADSARRSHRSFFAEHAAELVKGESLAGPEIALFEADRPNYRVVLLDALSDRDAATALRLVSSLATIWFTVGELADSYALIRAALELSGGAERDRGVALVEACDLAAELGRLDEAARLLEEADLRAAAIGDDLLLYRTLRSHHWLAMRSGDYAEAIEWVERAVQAGRAMGSPDREMAAVALQVQAMRSAAIDRDDPDVSTLERCLPLAATVLDHWSQQPNALFGQLLSHGELAMIYLGLSRFHDALGHAQETLRLERAVGTRWVSGDLLGIGFIAGGLGQHEKGVRLVSAARRQYELDSREIDPDDVRYLRRFEVEAEEALGEDGYEAAVRAGEALLLDEAIDLALSIELDEAQEG